MSDYHWGRGIGFVPHRIQHAWLVGEYVNVSMCGSVVWRAAGTVDFESDAARCERCAARVSRMKAEA